MTDPPFPGWPDAWVHETGEEDADAALRRRPVDPIVVMTANIGNGLADPRRLARVILGSGADIVALQEVSASQAEEIADALDDALPHSDVHGRGIAGKGIISRFPLARTRHVEIVPGRPDLEADVELPCGLTRVIVAHPEPPRFGAGSAERNLRSGEHIRRLAQDVASSDLPALLMGDFNRVSWQRAARALSEAGLHDAWLAAGRGPGFTLPARWAGAAYRGNPLGRISLPPVARVDYVWHTPHFRAERAWLGDAAGSDHRPVLARLRRTG